MKVPVRYHFQWRKAAVGLLQRVTSKKKIQSATQKYRTPSKLQNEIKKNYSCFSEIPKNFICVRVRQVAFLSEDLQNLSVWSSVLFTIFAAEMREREA